MTDPSHSSWYIVGSTGCHTRRISMQHCNLTDTLENLLTTRDSCVASRDNFWFAFPSHHLTRVSRPNQQIRKNGTLTSVMCQLTVEVSRSS